MFLDHFHHSMPVNFNLVFHSAFGGRGTFTQSFSAQLTNLRIWTFITKPNAKKAKAIADPP
jgi:hypothetical protein